MYLEFTAVARSGVDLADGQASAEPPPRHAIDLRGEFGERLGFGIWRLFRERSLRETLEEKLAHGRIPLKVVPGIGTVERLVAERKVSDDVALDGRFQQRPLEP